MQLDAQESGARVHVWVTFVSMTAMNQSDPHQRVEFGGFAGEQVSVDSQRGEDGLVAGTKHGFL